MSKDLYVSREPGGFYRVHTGDGYTIANSVVTKAHADRFAASGDLLAVAEMTASFFEGLDWPIPTAARAAITKAKGE